MKRSGTPSTTRNAGENPVTLAKHAIRVLEAHIRKTHDLTLPMGAELEFGVLPKGLNKGYSEKSPYGVPDSGGKIPNHSASVFRVPKHRDPWFPESRRVSYSYEEVSADDQWDKLEVVLSHRPSDADGKPIAHDGLILARNIEALSKQLHAPVSGYKPSTRGKSPSQIGATGWRHFRQHELADLSTEPVVKGTLNTNGLHLNMSLVDASTGDNVLDHAGHHRAELIATLSNHIGRLFHENAYLLATGQGSISRWQSRAKPDKENPTRDFVHYVRRKGTASYLENAIPDASANPYYAMMLQLAGTAQALDRCAFTYHESEPLYRTEPTPTFDTTRNWSTTNLRTLNDAFTASRNLRDILNGCEPALGDRFMAAIEKSSPSKATPHSQKAR